jgi:hypothetical protein
MTHHPHLHMIVPGGGIAPDGWRSQTAASSSSTRLVTFRYKNYRRDGADRQQVMTLATDEFIRRFLIHVLPHGFHRIRHYGLLAGSSRKDSLALARELLEVAPQPEEPALIQEPADPPCPCCGGTMVIIETFAPWCQPRAPPAPPTSNRETIHDPG